jgi:hypothetical protein
MLKRAQEMINQKMDRRKYCERIDKCRELRFSLGEQFAG